MPEFGKYHLVAELARGGMGVVYLACSQGPAGFSKLLVVKELKHEMASDRDFVTMFLDEARVAARLAHPNIVQTNEVGSLGDRHFTVMEFLDGRTLHRIVRRLADRGGLSLGGHLRILSEVLLGLQYAHELRGFDGKPIGLVHRDISPHNVMVTFDGQVKVLDFGIAKVADSSLDTKAGVLKGRIAYMAPEQARGERVDRRADLYSVGVMIWEAASGQRMWKGKSDVEILSHLLSRDLPTLSSVAPDALPELDAVCKRAMARLRDERYATAADLHADLEHCIGLLDEVPTMRQLGAIITEAFAEERTRMASTIDEALSRLGSGGGSSALPAVDVYSPSGTPSDAKATIPDEGSSASLPILHTPSNRLGAGALSTSTRPTAGGGLVEPSGAGAATARSAPSTSRVARWATAGGVAVLVLAVAVTVARLRSSSVEEGTPPGVSAPSPQAAAVRPPPAVVSVPELIDLQVRASPASARISIDGTPTATNPFHGRYPKDGTVHRVDVTADGFDTRSEQVAFSENATIDVRLDRHAVVSVPRFYGAPPPRPPAPRPETAAADAPNPAPQSQQQPPPAATFNPAGGRAPLRPIDSANPYGNQ